MLRRSFRARLIAINVAILAIALFAISTALLFVSERQAMANIDRELSARILRPRPPMGQRGGPGFGQGQGQGRGPGQAPMDERRPGAGPMDRGLRFFTPLGQGEAPIAAVDGEAVRRAWQGVRDVRTVRRDGTELRVITIPVFNEERIEVVGQATRDLADVRLMATRQKEAMLLISPLGLIFAGLGGLFLANRALRPIDKMAEASQQIHAESLTARLPVSGDDEMSRLAQSFNQLLARLEKSFAAEKQAYHDLIVAYEAQRQFAADASHELRTPLSRIKLIASSTLAQAVPPDEQRQALVTIEKTADGMAALVSDLLDLARADADQLSVHPKQFSISELVSDVIELTAPEHGPKVAHEGVGPDLVTADPQVVRRILTNLVANAVRHTEPGGSVTVKTQGMDHRLMIEVSDTGEGIASDQLDRVFDRFYRVESDRSRKSGGTGLGLAMVKTLAEVHGGSVSLTSTLGQGTVVKVELLSS